MGAVVTSSSYGGLYIQRGRVIRVVRVVRVPDDPDDMVLDASLENVEDVTVLDDAVDELGVKDRSVRGRR